MAEDDPNNDPDFQRERQFHNDTITICDLEDANETLNEEMLILQKIVELMDVEIGQVKLENAILRAGDAT